MGSQYEWGLPARYGGRFFVEGVPDEKFPDDGMSAPDAYQLLQEEVELDGDPARHTGARTLADDLAKACKALDKNGPLHEHDRKRARRAPHM